MKINLCLIFFLFFLISRSFPLPVYPENGYLESIFPENIQKFINVTVGKKCTYSDYISGFHEEPIHEENGVLIYTVEIILRDYDGIGFISVMKNHEGSISLVDLHCPTFF